MRYLLLPIILICTIACGDDSVKPLRKNKDQDQDLILEAEMDMEMGGSDMEMEVGGSDHCPPVECRSEELLNLLQVEKPYEIAALGGFEFEPEPFEFRDMGM